MMIVGDENHPWTDKVLTLLSNPNLTSAWSGLSRPRKLRFQPIGATGFTTPSVPRTRTASCRILLIAPEWCNLHLSPKDLLREKRQNQRHVHLILSGERFERT